MIGAAAGPRAAAPATAGLLGAALALAGLLAGCAVPEAAGTAAGTAISTPTAAITQSTTPTGAATAATGSDDSTDDSTVDSAAADDPTLAPAAPPARVVIPSIGVDAEVVAVGLTDAGQMQVPDFGTAGWYTEGPVPGDPGPGVVVAHVSSRRGPDVFARLAELSEGDLITVRATDGVERTWTVVGTEQADKDALPTDSIWNQTTERVLRLITCAGTIDPDTGHYEDNWIVYAEPVLADL